MRKALLYLSGGSLLTVLALFAGMREWISEIVVRPLLWPLYVVLVGRSSFWDILGAPDHPAANPILWIAAIVLNGIYLGAVLWVAGFAVRRARRTPRPAAV